MTLRTDFNAVCHDDTFHTEEPEDKRNYDGDQDMCEYGSIIPRTVVITKEKNEGYLAKRITITITVVITKEKGYLAKRITLRSGNPGVKHQAAILESWLDTFVSHLIQIRNSHHSTWNLSHSTKGAIFYEGSAV